MSSDRRKKSYFPLEGNAVSRSYEAEIIAEVVESKFTLDAFGLLSAAK